MCLLIIKPKNVEYDHDFVVWSINNGSTFNRDGIGAAVRKQSTNTLKLNKGFFNNNVNYLINWLKECDIQAEDELMVHLRQGTAGGVTTYNSHPYILGEESFKDSINPLVSILTLDDDNVTTGVFAHNGIFWRNSYHTFDGNLSDTYNWAINHFGTISDIDNLKVKGDEYFNEKENSYISEDLNGQKVCFMFPDRDLIRVGNFISEKGYLFSNRGYSNGSYNDRGGVEITGSNHVPMNMHKHTPIINLLPAKNETPAEIIVDNSANLEVKKTINTTFDFTVEITANPKPDTKVIGFRPSKKSINTYSLDRSKLSNDIRLEDIDIFININKDNKDHFILKAKENLCINNKSINKNDKFFIYNVYDSVTTGNAHALSLRPTNIDNEQTYIIKNRDINIDFQLSCKDKYFPMYRDYMKLVGLYGIDISNNKKKKLRALYNSLKQNNKLPAYKTFYKAKYEPQAIIMFYDNFYKEDSIREIDFETT
jgi:hypothetical protein